MFLHDLTAELDYGVDWTSWLASGETITTSTWSVPSELVKVSDTINSGVAVVWLKAAGGATVSSKPVIVSNSIITSQGRKDKRSIPISLTSL